jgi:hypothetical protein
MSSEQNQAVFRRVIAAATCAATNCRQTEVKRCVY